MSTHTASIQWSRRAAKFSDNRYSRAHTWQFDGGLTIPASSSPHVVPMPCSDPAGVDPEEAFVAALSSCHMLWFLSIAAKHRFVVDAYGDQPAGFMGKNETGKEVIKRVTLAPHVVFTGDKVPTGADVQALHHEAHEECFLANSVKTAVVIEGTWEFLTKGQPHA